MGRALLMVFLLGVGISTAFVFREMVTECPDHPEMCFDRVTNEFYASGSKWSRPGECVMMFCAFPEMRGTGCVKVNVEPPCEILPANLSLPYPDCCPRGYCPPNAIY